jgi:hypothetical protein
MVKGMVLMLLVMKRARTKILQPTKERERLGRVLTVKKRKLQLIPAPNTLLMILAAQVAAQRRTFRKTITMT